MKPFLLFVLIVLTLTRVSAQLPSAYLKPSKSKQLGAISKTSTLFVVIENEKRPDDAALVEAVKKYWTIGPVKYLSLLEFTEKFRAGSLDKSNLYLYNNHNEALALPGMLTVSSYQGFYLTNDPVRLYSSGGESKAPGYLFFSSNYMYDQKGVPIKGFYSLMARNFDHDIRYCQDENNFKRSKKLKRKNGILFFLPMDTITTKTTLLVKEQTNRQEKDVKKKKSKKMQKKRREYITDSYTNKKPPVIVFPEDIDFALQKKDADILLYNGGCLYSAENGAVYATSRGQSTGGGSWASAVTSVILISLAIVYILN